MRPDDEDTPMVPRIAVVQDDLTPADSASAVGRPNSPGAPIGYSPIDTSTIPSDGLREEIDSLRREAQAARQAQALAEAKVKILENELLRSREDLRKANDRNSDLLTHFGKQVESLETEINTMSEKGYGGPNGTRNDEFIAVQQELIATKMECQKRESELERLKELAAEELSHLHGNTITKKYPMAN
jgi:chromosome segregation ATPase